MKTFIYLFPLPLFQWTWKSIREVGLKMNCSTWSTCALKAIVPDGVIMISFQDFSNQRGLFLGVDYWLKNTCHCVEFEFSLFLWWFCNVFNVTEQKQHFFFFWKHNYPPQPPVEFVNFDLDTQVCLTRLAASLPLVGLAQCRSLNFLLSRLP